MTQRAAQHAVSEQPAPAGRHLEHGREVRRYDLPTDRTPLDLDERTQTLDHALDRVVCGEL